MMSCREGSDLLKESCLKSKVKMRVKVKVKDKGVWSKLETPRSWLNEALETDQLGGGFEPITEENVRDHAPAGLSKRVHLKWYYSGIKVALRWLLSGIISVPVDSNPYLTRGNSGCSVMQS